MNRSFLLALFAFAMLLCVTTSAAYAQATRTWISGVGDDANPCSRTAPCKTWAGAISKTAVGGEIDALDPGGFGGVTITKSITLDGGGGQVASILVSGTPGISVNAGPSDVITLRNLRLQGLVQSSTPGTTGINFVTGGQLNVEDCYIANFANAGINFAPQATSSLNVTHSTIEGNRGGGIIVSGLGSGPARATIDSTEIVDNTLLGGGTGPGIEATGLTRVMISNSTISENHDGLFATGSTAVMFVSQSNIANNFGNGLHASNSAAIAAAQSTIIANHLLGVLGDTGGTVSSFGNNFVHSNSGGSGVFTPPTLTPMTRMLRLNGPP